MNDRGKHDSFNNSSYHPAGLVFAELVVVIVIMSMIAALVMLNFAPIISKTKFERQAYALINVLKMAQNAAAESDRRYAVILDFVEQTYILRQFASLDLETIPEVSSSSEPREQWQEPILRERSRDTETRIDGPPKPTQLEFVFRRTDLDTILEVASTLEWEESISESFVLEQVVPYAKMQKPNHQEPIIEEPNI